MTSSLAVVGVVGSGGRLGGGSNPPAPLTEALIVAGISPAPVAT